MTGLLFLLGEMGLLLLLAAIAGWYLGWSWRGFHERDRLEDVRRLLRATEDVKDRELTEAHHRASSLENQLEAQQRRAERLERDLQTAAATALAVAPTVAPTASAIDVTRPEALPEMPPVASPPLAEVGELHERLAEADASLDAEAARRREAEGALRDKTAALLTLQAELQGLRQAAGERAAELARLEARLAEVEGGAAGDADIRLQEARQQLASQRQQLDEAHQQQAALQRELGSLRAELDARDRRINELRVRYQDTTAALEEERARLRGLEAQARSGGAREEVLELQRLLQRQIERNGKLEAVHRAVVANLQAQVGASPAAPPRPASESAPAAAGNGATDDLTRIHGIGPRLAARLAELGVTRYAQIATWTEEDIEHMTHELGDLTDRVRRDGWVEGAREQLRAKYGDAPWR